MSGIRDVVKSVQQMFGVNKADDDFKKQPEGIIGLTGKPVSEEFKSILARLSRGHLSVSTKSKIRRKSKLQ